MWDKIKKHFLLNSSKMNLTGGAFCTGTRVMYPIEVKEKAIQMKKENIAVRVIMEELGIKNKTQIETWWRWYRNGEEPLI